MVDIDESLVDLASISETAAEALELQDWDVLQLCLSPSIEFPIELLTCVVQVVRNTQNESSDTDDSQGTKKSPTVVGIHPLLHEYLCTSYNYLSVASQERSSIQVDEQRNGQHEEQKSEEFTTVVAVPLTVPGAAPQAINDPFLPAAEKLPWKAKHIKTIRALPPHSSISLSCIYLDDELRYFCTNSPHFITKLQSTISFFLEGRILKAGTTALIPTLEGMAIVVVSDIVISDLSNEDEHRDIAYRIGDQGSFSLEVVCDDIVTSANESSVKNRHTALTMTWESECPGYDKLVEDLLQLVNMRGLAAPSGILLTGSPQVGKSHVASCVAHKLISTSSAEVHWVSVQDLLLQATWATEADLMDILQPSPQSSLNRGQLLVIDDLHILSSDESVQDAVQANTDPELLVVLNSIVQTIDEISSRQSGKIAILGIGQNSNNLPKELVRIGRLEKEVAMPPPTQGQREAILRYLIQKTAENNGEGAERWAEALAPVTVGCVAGDLCRLLAAAWTRASARSREGEVETSSADISWEDLQEVTRTYVPMQLVDVDVCKPQSFFRESTISDEDDFAVAPDDWAKIHELSWAPFGGYANVKKRLFRTVVGPWKRFLKSLDCEEENNSSSSMGLSPPPGVLFHGPSGNGKTFAAACLGSSLGLPMIKVRASDVMDKWLGGSEAIIRSLFLRARSAAPCILLFDEIDAIASNRASDNEGSADVMSRLLSTLLNEMDGISSDKRRSGVLVVACTNRLEDLDKALLRPGRLEEHIVLEKPNATDIADMLNIHLSRVPLAKNISLCNFANQLAEESATAADVEGFCREACLIALHRTESTEIVLAQEDLVNALGSFSL